MGYDTCLRALVRHNWPVDQVDLRGDFIELSTPLEITVQNLRVLLKFEKCRLTRLQVGTLDNLNIEPHDYPLKH